MALLGRKLGRSRRAAPFFGMLPAIVGLIALVSPLEEASACRTRLPTQDYQTAVKTIRASDAIFVGTVTSSSSHSVDDRNPHARIKVEIVWKGKLAKRVTLHTIVGPCRENSSKPYPKGSRYLVFATKIRDGYHVIRHWSFYDARAPAEVMRALKDHKSGS